MRNLPPLAACLAAVLLAACHGVNQDLNPQVEVTAINLPAELTAGTEVDFTCDFVAESGAATLSWDFGGGAVPNSGGPAPAGGQATATVTLAEVSTPTEFTLTVEIRDNTNQNRSDSMEITYTVSPPPPPVPPA